MTALTMRNSRGQLVEVESVSATAAKNSLGAVLQKAQTQGAVAITQRNKPRAVVLSMDEFEAMVARLPDELGTLREEFDALVTRAQKPGARAAGRALFKATPAELGRAAVASSRKRG